MRWPSLNPRFVVYATVLIFAAQNFGTESVHDELVRLQEQQGLTLAWIDNNLQGMAFMGRESSANPFRAVLFKRRRVIPLKDSVPPLQPPGFKFSDIPRLATIDLCWSHDQTKLAATMNRSGEGILGIFDLRTKTTQTFDSQVGQDFHFTSQCWSPDDKYIAYEAEGNVKVFLSDEENSRIRVIAKGTYVTWSPDGDWIAFLNDDTYYAMHPDGSGRRKLFHNYWGGAASALYWSPDSRIVAYVRELGFLQGGTLDAEANQLRARRLEDGSEDRLCPNGVDGYADYQWVTSPELIKKPN
jgi:WD40-like Beta Propeller Repeat